MREWVNVLVFLSCFFPCLSCFVFVGFFVKMEGRKRLDILLLKGVFPGVGIFEIFGFKVFLSS